MPNICLCLFLALSTVPTKAVLCPVVPAPPTVGMRATYSGRLQALEDADVDQSGRTFRLTYLVTEIKPNAGPRLIWLLEEGAGGPHWTWAQRFGEVSLGASFEPSSDREEPAIQADRDGNLRVIPLPLVFFGSPEPIRAGGQWGTREGQFQVAGTEETAGRKCWKIGLTTNLGPKGVFWVDQQNAILVRWRQIVFLGLGVPYELSLDLEKSEDLTPEAAAQVAKAHLALAGLRGTVKGKLSELPETDLPATAAFQERAQTTATQIQTDLKSGPYVDLARDVVRETQTGLDRERDVARLRDRVVGKPAKEFVIRTTRGEQVSLADFRGMPVVLHFWDYRSEPKVAPYGETGYLDFVWRQRQKEGIRVLGIAVDRRLRDESVRPTARKDVRSFCEFMNLSYPIAFDDGDKSVIELFGDPRTVGGRMPLYVVIAPDGTVADYHVGLWSATADEGLKALDQQLRALRK